MREKQKLNLSSVEFEKILPTIRPELHRYCARMTGSVIDGEDVLQIALIRAFEALGKGIIVLEVKNWLFRIAHNSALNFLRSRKLETSMTNISQLPAEMYSLMPGSSNITDALWPFLELPARQRSAVILRDVLGYSATEVSELTDSSLAAVKSALHRGRSNLRKAVTKSSEIVRAASISLEQKETLATYAQHFNNHNFDELRDMLAEEVKLELVARGTEDGKAQVSNYYGNYAKVDDWLMAAGVVENKPALLVFDRADPQGSPLYFILLNFDDRVLQSIRDFRYARYAIKDCDWQRFCC